MGKFESVRRVSGISAIKLWAVVWRLFLAVPLLASGQEPQPDPPEYEELDEVLVSGRTPEKSGQKVIEWMARLVGQFTFAGHVDPRGMGNSGDWLSVEGSSDCVGFGVAPAVQCEIRVRWPVVPADGGDESSDIASTLDPAMILFGFDADRFGIRYMLVDNEGIAQGALGLIYGDTLMSTHRCVDAAGKCQRIVRITAEPDLKAVTMSIDVEIDDRKVRSYAFVMSRVPGSKSVVVPATR